ncbi:MAG: spore coat protein CotJB [Oscillospiraceae bacterium]
MSTPHPDDREAFETLQKCIRLSAEGPQALYVEQYGPVTVSDLACSDVYDWLNAPWPWQPEGEGK